ncbi:hypothetical protein [Pseudomonas sp. RIT-PI-S]|uniref:hypothetical protein n=1 Tax=Pseudomonas sp. RIT-PI-S TaxID=3035295 RepID=UPI0021D902B5|nr:hypothetical protein [Pseudomonas sp. RIT-PI-S]
MRFFQPVFGVTLIKSILAPCLVLLAGCVGHYQQPAADAPHATLNAQWGTNNLMNGGGQGYWAFYDSHCVDTEETGVLGAISATNSEKNRFFIKPDRRVYVHALSTGIKIRENNDQPLISKSCLNISSFVPRTGGVYRIKQSAPDWGCSLEVIDMSTGTPPNTLVVEPITKECGLN